ncbi:monothiol glutaredoxin [Rhodanobacter sp. ANJX3]|uniref:Grx4 family monothiol glutaredoxin n=1 Tax=unclassified Rhodanobacter TaxID=2621553 RepID=UPI0015C6B43D|nr:MULTISPECIES: Grx4 family monothiol glutaredoxin [unclassified Rhodanobacter]MBB5359764.1 monothiol glutaredoxin [Rhodanobacter sp. ANJX3]NYE28679.1 monothiol glutaredoxin [Rhodanobacter sp. K2T2]
MSLDSATRERIETVLKDHRVVLFMKGDRRQPQCGFSAAATNMLNELLPDYHTINVLEDPEIREGIKAYGEWPTIPQLYVEGELIGGADIIRQLYTSGELHELFGAAKPDRTPPEITITDAAAEAIRQGTANAQGVALHLEIGPDHSAGFQLAPAGEHDIVAHSNGLEVHFDPASAQRAKGIVIDWVSTVQGEGLSLKFPGPQEIKSLTVQELKARLAAGDVTLIDVRPAHNRAAVPPLPQARVLDDEGYERLAALPKDTALAFICNVGISSQSMAERFAAHGFSNVYNVAGGMEAWHSA